MSAGPARRIEKMGKGEKIATTAMIPAIMEESGNQSERTGERVNVGSTDAVGYGRGGGRGGGLLLW